MLPGIWRHRAVCWMIWRSLFMYAMRRPGSFFMQTVRRRNSMKEWAWSIIWDIPAMHICTAGKIPVRTVSWTMFRRKRPGMKCVMMRGWTGTSESVRSLSFGMDARLACMWSMILRPKNRGRSACSVIRKDTGWRWRARSLWSGNMM